MLKHRERALLFLVLHTQHQLRIQSVPHYGGCSGTGQGCLLGGSPPSWGYSSSWGVLLPPGHLPFKGFRRYTRGCPAVTPAGRWGGDAAESKCLLTEQQGSCSGPVRPHLAWKVHLAGAVKRSLSRVLRGPGPALPQSLPTTRRGSLRLSASSLSGTSIPLPKDTAATGDVISQ